MDVISQLLIASLFSLHQYIPADQTEAVKYFDYAADPVTLQSQHDGLTIVAAAHQSCRHFFKVGGAELDFSEAEIVNFAFTVFDQYEEDLIEVGSSKEKARDILRKVCQSDFNPRAFSRAELNDIESFIKNQVAILTPKELDSTGSYKYFGKVELYDRKGKDMGPLMSLGGHWVSIQEIAPVMPQALLAAEDSFFYRHEGVYLGSLVRMAYNLRASDSGNITGGSTITMQLLKNLYFNTWPDDPNSAFEQKSKLKTLLRKVREWYWAKVYEKYHERLGPGSGKRYVLEQYLNLMDYGPGVRGIDQASRIFLNKSPGELTLSDAAFLATLFKAPSRYSRPSNYERFTAPRRRYVLEQMSSLNWNLHGLDPITSSEREQAGQEPLPQWQGANPLLETAVDQYIRTYAQEFLNNQVELPEDARAIESELVTTLDMDLQKVVFESVRNRLDTYDNGRQTVRRVGPARDDRSRVAVPLATDLRTEEMGALRDLQTRFEDLQLNMHISVFLGDSGSRSGSSKSYFHLRPKDQILTSTLQAEHQRALSASAQFVGQILITELDAQRCDGLQVSDNYYPLQSVLQQYSRLPETQQEDSQIEESPSVETLPPMPAVTEVAQESTIVPFRLPTDPNEIPLPRPRPANADEIIAQRKENERLNRLFSLPSGSRPAPQVPYAPFNGSACVRLVSDSDLKTLQLLNTVKNTEDFVSKRLVRHYVERLEMLAPREDMYPAVFDGRNRQSNYLVVAPAKASENREAPYFQWVRPINLTTQLRGENHASHLQRNVQNNEFRVGQAFWVRAEDSRNVFSLSSPKLQAAVVVMDSESGDVLANFGGYLPQTSRFFDRSRLALRQPGSTLKPWLYYLALNKNFEPYSMIQNDGVVFRMPGRPDYRPDNFSSGGSSYVTLEAALTRSLNKPAVGILTDSRFGPDPVQNLTEFIDLLSNVGLYDRQTVQIIPSTALGAQGVSITDLVSSFTYFANGQYIAKPRFFKTLNSGQGQNLYSSSPQASAVPYANNRQALFQLQSLMLKTANAGTAARLRNFPSQNLGQNNCADPGFGIGGQICFGGKTGTSNDSKDNWFVGFSKKFVIGVWVGYDYPESTQATGGEISLPIFMDIVEKGKEFLPAVEPVVTEVPAGLNAVRVGNGQACRSMDNSGSVVFAKNNGADLPQCMSCRCEARLYQGADYDYWLHVNGQYVARWETADDGRVDQANCENYARSLGCSL